MTESIGTETESPSYRLVIYSDSSVHTVALHGTSWIIGRGEECDIYLRDPTVSRQHLRVERRGDEFHFVDLGGKNPICLDGKPCQSGTLALGSSLTVGLTRITLDRRANRLTLIPESEGTRVIPREVLDETLRDAPPSAAPAAGKHLDVAVSTLESLEIPLADLGSIEDVAEPMLDLALNLTSRTRGLIGKFFDGDEFVCLASMDREKTNHELRVPLDVLRDASLVKAPFLEVHDDHGTRIERLLVPLVNGTKHVLLLEAPRSGAPSGQDALRMARALGGLIGQTLREMEHRIELRKEVARLRRSSTAAQGMVIASFRLSKVRAQLRECNDSREHVVVIGEEGSEKEAVARYAHEIARDTRGGFVAFHPSLVPTNRLMETLLGHDGALRNAHQGTLFLDHPETLPIEVQKVLAQAVRSLQVTTADGAAVACAVRLVMGLVDESSRSMLAAELNSLVHCEPLHIPPLRDDPRDILVQAELLLAELGPDTTGTPRALSDRAKNRLSAFPWPGNLRQLRQVLEQAAARAGSEPIQPRHLPAEIRDASEGDVVRVASLEDMERRHIRDVLARTGGNRSKTATLLGIASSTLYEKMRKYGIG